MMCFLLTLAAQASSGVTSGTTTTIGIQRRRLRPGGASAECRALLEAEALDWVLEPFACGGMETSNASLVLGTGLGNTGTRSVAAAVELLGVPTCHQAKAVVALLRSSSPRDMRPFARSRAYFDTPMATLWRRLACAFPNYAVVHTTRAGYRRDYAHREPGQSAKCTAATPLHFRIVRCLEYGSACPTLDDTLAAFEAIDAEVHALVPRARLHVMNLSAGFELQPLAAFLGRAVPPGLASVPNSTAFFCHKLDDAGFKSRRHWPTLE